MMRAVLAALVAATAHLPLLPHQAPPDLRPAVVIGRIVDAADGRAVRRAIVRIEHGGDQLTRVADERGRFYFSRLPAGTYSITAMRDGYFDGAFGRVHAGGEPLDLPLAPGEWRADVEIPMFRPATIAGMVYDEGNEPAAGVLVEALRREFTDEGDVWRPATARAQTDDRGEYRLTGLLPGEYVVLVPSVQATMPHAAMEEVGRSGRSSRDVMAVLFMNGGPGALASGQLMSGILMDDDDANSRVVGATATPPAAAGGVHFAYATTFYPASDAVESAVPIQLAPGESRAGVNFTLAPLPAVSVTGRVGGSEGPVPGLFLRLLRQGAADTGVSSIVAATLSAPDGSFAFLGVPAGAYVLHARTPTAGLIESRTPPSVALQGQERLFGELPLAVFDRDVSDVVVTMASGGSIAGRVQFEGASDAPVARQRANLHVRLRQSTGAAADVPALRVDADGTFEIAGVRPGRYIVEAGGMPDGWFVSSVTEFGRDVLRDPIDVDAGADAVEVIVTLTDRPAGVTGAVYDRMRRPQPGARVVAVPAGRTPGIDPDAAPFMIRSVRADVYGVFTLTGLAPGAYDVVVLDDRSGARWRDVRSLAEAAGRPVRVTVTAGQLAQVSVLK